MPPPTDQVSLRPTWSKGSPTPSGNLPGSENSTQPTSPRRYQPLPSSETIGPGGGDGGCRKTKDDTDRPQGLQPAHDSFLSRTLNSARPGSAGAARVPAARIDDQPNQVKRRLTLTVRRGSPARHDQAASASPETETARGGPRAARSVLPPLSICG